jgi:tellurite resistance protein TerC
MSNLTRANKAAMVLKWAIGLLFLVSAASAAERDVVIVLDNSRNMERFDAAGLVRSAVSRFLHELNANAQAALILASDTPAVAIPFIPLTVEAHARFHNALQRLTYRGNYTDIALALQQAVHDLVYSGREKVERSILLIVGALSDPRDPAAVQFRLHVLDYPVGSIDGVIGPRTRVAIREFQRDHRLAVDGQLSRGLLARLEEVYAERWQAELSAEATRAGIKIVTVALGGESTLSRRLAEKTSGEYFQIAGVEALPQVFERLKGTFTRAAEAPQSVPPGSAALPAPEAEAPGVKPPRKDLLTKEWMWIGFILLILLLLILDLVVFHRKAHVIKVGEALVLSGVWIGLALLFNVFIYFIYEHHWLGLDAAEDELDGRTAAVLFFTGYVVEKSLSVDNLFVIAMIFSYFGVPPQYQHRVLFWGIFGALLMRAVLILVGVGLIERFHWILYLFGAFLIFTAAKMLLVRHEHDPRDNRLVQLTRRLFPITENYVGQRFTVRVDSKFMFTPLALALIAVESADLMFAVDSIPAIFAITDDPFILFSSNAFAILGLRSLYFALAGIIDKFHYLKLSLALLLALVGVKMLLKDVLHAVPNITYYTLGAIALILTAGVVASLIRAQRMANKDEPEGP